MALSTTAVGVLQELENRKDAQMSGNKNRDEIERLVEAGYVTCHTISVDAEVYNLTEAGRAVLKSLNP